VVGLLIILGILVAFFGLTLLVTRLCRTRHHAEVPEHIKRQAIELRRRAARLNTGSDDIEERARRLEQMLSVKRKED
jgi:hypothetical protein